MFCCAPRRAKKMILKRRFLALLLIAVVFGFIWYTSTGSLPVNGWGGNVSRNANDYVSERLTPLIFQRSFCAEQKLLLVMISSRPDGFQARLAIRETWGRKHPNVSFFFLLGEVNSVGVQKSLDAESQHFEDIIQERFQDTYNNLTLKSINMLKLFTLHCTATHRYLMKVDDDLYLNTASIVHVLSERKHHDNVLFGRVKSGVVPSRNIFNKWYMSYELYPHEKFPPHLCGPGYLMSSDVAEKLYRCALQVPLIHFEDVYLTGICAHQMNIKLLNSYSFKCNSSNNICLYKDAYILHYNSPDDIREIYRILQNDLCKHYGEFSVILKWIFFLNVP